VGIAAGPVIPRGGDYYGPVVNLASRLTGEAADGEVLAPASICAELPTDRFECHPAGIRQLRGIGPIETATGEPVREGAGHGSALLGPGAGASRRRRVEGGGHDGEVRGRRGAQRARLLHGR